MTTLNNTPVAYSLDGKTLHCSSSINQALIEIKAKTPGYLGLNTSTFFMADLLTGHSMCTTYRTKRKMLAGYLWIGFKLTNEELGKKPDEWGRIL